MIAPVTPAAVSTSSRAAGPVVPMPTLPIETVMPELAVSGPLKVELAEKVSLPLKTVSRAQVLPKQLGPVAPEAQLQNIGESIAAEGRQGQQQANPPPASQDQPGSDQGHGRRRHGGIAGPRHRMRKAGEPR